jgi:threonine dehydrogenase-like Zn-dependent dehydrogenase
MVRGTDFDQALELVASRREGWDDVAPAVIGLDDVAEHLTLLGTGRSPAVKVLVDPSARQARNADTRPARLQEV